MKNRNKLVASMNHAIMLYTFGSVFKYPCSNTL